jgi:hypothetical protein
MVSVGNTSFFEVVAICDHLAELTFTQLKDEIRWESGFVPTHLLIETLCWDSIDLGKIAVEQYSKSPEF